MPLDYRQCDMVEANKKKKTREDCRCIANIKIINFIDFKNALSAWNTAAHARIVL